MLLAGLDGQQQGIPPGALYISQGIMWSDGFTVGHCRECQSELGYLVVFLLDPE